MSAAKSVGSIDEFKSLVDSAKNDAGSDALKGNLHKVISNPKFKYSRLFAIGLYNAIEAIDASVLDDKEKREALLDKLAEDFSLNNDLLKKDIDLYRGNLEKMAQAQEVMKDMIEAEKKKQAKREEEKKAREAKKESASTAEETATADTAPADTEGNSESGGQ